MYTYKKLQNIQKSIDLCENKPIKILWEENWEDYKRKEKFCYQERWTEDAA